MRTLRASVAALAVAIVLFQSTASTGMAQDQRKPLLSEEIRRVLEADGPEAAQRRFDEIFPIRRFVSRSTSLRWVCSGRFWVWPATWCSSM
ncbi:MAG: hypothetical protein P8Y07_15215 [Gemmatimonadales bacterium]